MIIDQALIESIQKKVKQESTVISIVRALVREKYNLTTITNHITIAIEQLVIVDPDDHNKIVIFKINIFDMVRAVQTDESDHELRQRIVVQMLTVLYSIKPNLKKNFEHTEFDI